MSVVLNEIGLVNELDEPPVAWRVTYTVREPMYGYNGSYIDVTIKEATNKEGALKQAMNVLNGDMFRIPVESLEGKLEVKVVV